jgi:hypothetical protein
MTLQDSFVSPNVCLILYFAPLFVVAVASVLFPMVAFDAEDKLYSSARHSHKPRTWSARRLLCRQVNQHTVKLDCLLLTHSVFVFLFPMGWLHRVVAGGLLFILHKEQCLTAVDLLILITSYNSCCLILSCLYGCAIAQPMWRIGTTWEVGPNGTTPSRS